MSKLAHTIAGIIRQQVVDATKGRTGEKLESRFIFHGPPKDLLEQVFDELASHAGVQLALGADEAPVILPVLLPLPAGELVGENPAMGCSGKCDESHLLDVRDHPGAPSFLALVPPGLHINASIDSTTGKFGIAAWLNARHIPFAQWWEDEFVQHLVKQGLHYAGLGNQEVEGAQELVGHAAAALDEMDENQGSRIAVWCLLSRIYSISGSPHGLSPGQALALACGVPPMQDGGIDSKIQTSILGRVAEEMTDGFNAGIERLGGSASGEVKQALDIFLRHIQANCDVPTAFERATEAFYLPSDIPLIQVPPSWWSLLTAECWSELLSEEPSDLVGGLLIECTNPILPVMRGMPALVRGDVELAITADSGEAGRSLEVLLTGGSHGKFPIKIQVDLNSKHVDTPPTSGQKSSMTYKVESLGRKAATTKVISLATWAPGILVTCRMASKLTPPKKPRRSNSGIDWESSLTLPGSGRYELIILTSPGTSIKEVAGTNDDATESLDEGRKLLQVHEVRNGDFMVEMEAEGKYQIDVSFRLPEGEEKVCRTYISFEEAKSEGCRSEFERLIKCNRQHLEKFDTKAVVQLDRNARLSSLQTWMLDEQNVAMSFIPVVLADDYASVWAPPDWRSVNGPILSQARFLQDPRPHAELFQPPPGFIDARKAIAQRVRNSTDDQSGLVESTQLGKLLSTDQDFRALVETYLDTYTAWLDFDRDVACWVDVLAVCTREVDGRTLARIPEAIILSPLHPLRLAWHCLAQQVLYQEVEGDDTRPCPAASILDPDCIPDVLTMSLQSPSGSTGIDCADFLSLECSSDYWSVMWNGSRLGQLVEKSRQAPFDSSLGLSVGGISSGFSPAQVARALEDVTDLLAAKPLVSVVVSSAGGTTDACNEGLTGWCTGRFGNGDKSVLRQGVGPRMLEVYDTRPAHSRPDQATIANLSEDTGSHVRWFEGQPNGSRPDLGIIAQLDSAQPESTEVGVRSPISMGGLIRHRVRRQLHGAFLSESRQASPASPTEDAFAGKVATCIVRLEACNGRNVGLQFAPNVHAIADMLEDKKAGFVAVSSSAIDPACFLGGWIKGTYLWDYDLPSYSHRAGDTSGYYLLSQVRDADKESLARVLEPLPGGKGLDGVQVEQILLEVARRGIPTVRGLSGDDTGATGDLGLFLAVRLLQDQFRISGNMESLLPVLAGAEDDASIAIIIPVDPFRSYLADLARSLGRERKDALLSRPDLLVVGIRICENKVNLRLTPIEVKCRQSSIFGASDARDALGQARALTTLLTAIQERSSKSVIWKLAFQHLLLSMIGFGLRVYSQHEAVTKQSVRWAKYHGLIAATILGSDQSVISIDNAGRLVVVDSSPQSGPHDHDNDGLADTVVISSLDAGRIVAGDAQAFYNVVRTTIGDWRLMPRVEDPNGEGIGTSVKQPENSTHVLASLPEVSLTDTTFPDTAGSNALAEQNESKGGDIVNGSLSTAQSRAGIILSVGKTVDGFEPRPLSLNISNTRLNQLNIGVVGDLGTGKTQLLKSLIFQIATSSQQNRGIKPRLLIFDYKRDYSSPDFVEATGAKVIKPSRLPLNLFDTATLGESMAPWLDRFRFFADVLDKVYSGIGPVQRDKLKGAVRNAYESCNAGGRQPTIYDIHAEYRALLGGKSDSPMAIIDDLVDMEIFEPDPGKTKTFDEFLDGIVVISLDAMGQDDRSKNMLVAIMLNMFYENMLRTSKYPFEGSDPQLRVIDSYLLVDEADNIMRYEFDVLRKLLLQGREFGVGVILASQYLRHFKAGGTDYREPLLTWFIHKVPNVTPAELGALGFTSDLGDLSERVKSLPNHHCLYKSYDVAGEVIRGLPFYQLIQDKAMVP